MTEGTARLLPTAPWAFWAMVGVTLSSQLLFVYAIPAAVFECAPWWKALFLGVRETVRYPLSTLVIVASPTSALIAFAVTVPEVRVAQWMERTTPELAIALVAARLLVWMVVDAVMTVAIAHLWWVHRAPVHATAAAATPTTGTTARASRTATMEEGPVVA
jgi:glucan phosphoethanolaminetransferase (alkaline phosphatase superfamily)